MIFHLVSALALAAAPAPFGFEATRPSPRHPALVLAQRPGDRAALVVRFHAGAADDADTPGLTRVAQHALVQANARCSHASFARALFAGDGTLSIETGLREATFVLEADRRAFDRLATTLLELLFAPALDPALFGGARERANIDARESTGRKDLVALLAPKAIEDWRYGNAPYGNEDSLERVTLGDVRRHLTGPLSPSNATVIAAGAFDARVLRSRVARLSGGSYTPLPAPRLGTPFSLQVRARREIYILAYRTAFASPARTAAARLGASLLADRIHRSFREKGAGYSEAVFADHRRWLDLFLLALPAHDPSDMPLGTFLEDEVAAVRTGAFADTELERNRAWTLAELERVDREPEALARQLADGADPRWYGREVAAAIRTLDRPALVAALSQIFSEDAAIRVLYTPRANAPGAIPESFRRPRSAP